MLLTIIILGLLFMILMMALLFNPPEALVKRVFHGRSKPLTKTPNNSE